MSLWTACGYGCPAGGQKEMPSNAESAHMSVCIPSSQAAAAPRTRGPAHFEHDTSSPVIIQMVPKGLRARSPDAIHIERHRIEYGSEKRARQHCNRCKWIKLRDKWKAQCTYVAPSGKERSWITENPDWTGEWGLGCELCLALGQADKGVESSDSRFVKCVCMGGQVASCSWKM